jgi:hypothetical protein
MDTGAVRECGVEYRVSDKESQSQELDDRWKIIEHSGVGICDFAALGTVIR